MPTWDNTPPGTITIPGITFDNTPPGTITIPGITFSDSASAYQDPFTGTDGQEIDGWTQINDAFVYASNKAAEDPDGDGSKAYLTNRHCQNGYAQVELHGLTDKYQSLLFRIQSAGSDYYRVSHYNGNVFLYHLNTQLATAPITYAAGKVLRADFSGRDITIKYDGVPIISHTDNAAEALLAPGYVGLWGSESLGAVFDNFECGGVGAEPIPI